MKRPILLFLLAMLSGIIMQAQSDALFKVICSELEQMERYWNARQKLPAFTVRIDTAKNEEWMEFADGTGKRIKGKTGDPELRKVAFAQPLPVFPLGDTVCITDTIGALFAKGIQQNGHYFYVRKCLTRACKNALAAEGSMFVQSLRDVGDNRYVFFSFAGTGELFYCQFKIVNGKPEFHQSKKVPREKMPHLE